MSKDTACTTTTLAKAPRAARSSVGALHEALCRALQGTCGVAISGLSYSSLLNSVEWGPRLAAESGTSVFVCMSPADSWTRPPDPGEVRFVATKQLFCNGESPPRVCIAMCTAPSMSSIEPVETAEVARSAACGGVHMLVPALLSTHNPDAFNASACQKNEGAQPRDADSSIAVNDAGCVCIRPCITAVLDDLGTSLGPAGPLKVASGIASMRVAMALCNMSAHVADTGVPAAIKESEHASAMQLCVRVMKDAVGNEACLTNSAAAIRLIDSLTAEGLLCLMTHPFFSKRLPQLLTAPEGVPLLIVSACRFACLSNGFGLNLLPRDAQLVDELKTAFESQWSPLFTTNDEHVYAIDVVISNALTNARAHVKQHCTSGSAEAADPGRYISYWATIGIRLASVVMHTPRAARAQTTDLLHDPVVEKKNALFEKNGVSGKVLRSKSLAVQPIVRLRTALLRMHNDVEMWLRTGVEPNAVLSSCKAVPAVQRSCLTCDPAERCDCIAPAATAPDVCERTSSAEKKAAEAYETVLARRLNHEAMTRACSTQTAALVYGADVTEHMGLSTHLLSSYECVQCGMCDEKITSIGAALLQQSNDSCAFCTAPLCFKCSVVDAGAPCSKCKKGSACLLATHFVYVLFHSK